MSGTVVDASVALAWILEDEDDPRANRILDRLAEDVALVPRLWHLETRNALITVERRGRLSEREIKERLGTLNSIPIQTDDEPDFQAAFDLARKHGLPFYDALYLELAKRRDAELATLDRALGRAATAEDVPLSAA